MATDPLDGDVKRLRFSGSRGSNGDPIGYRPLRSEGGDAVNDDAFNLTPLDIRKQEFRKTLRGYDTLGVEDFQMRVADALERAMRERQVLEERVSALTEQLRQDSRAAAEREGQVIVREAEAEARRLLDEARNAENAVKVKMAATERQFQQYMGGFRALLERQLAELRALDGGSQKA